MKKMKKVERDAVDAAHRRTVMTDLAQHARSLAGEAARVEEYTIDSGRMLAVEIKPVCPDARAIDLVAHQWLMLSAGHNGGLWELNWDSEAEMQLARDLIASIISGRVEERFGPSRSMVTVTLANGSEYSETGIEGGSLWPRKSQSDWKRSGRLIQYAPYY